MARDYEYFKNRPNVTFIGICATPGASLRSMMNEEVTLKIKDMPFPKMLDASGATVGSYHLAFDVPYQLVVLDSEGKIAFNGDPRLRFRGENNYVRVKVAEKCLAKSPGLLPDVKAPESMAQAVHLFSLQQFDKLDVELARAKKADTSEAAKAFAQGLEDRIAASRSKRIEELKALAESDPIKAYFEVEAFLQCFPRSKEATAARSLLSQLKSKPAVRKELEARSTFERVLVPAMQRIRYKNQYDKAVAPVMKGYLQRYGTTQFATTAQAAVDAYQKTLR